jgi:DNA sulfur modification protein DndC
VPNMSKIESENPRSAFTERGLPATIEGHLEEIRELYTLDEIPWVVGYSGGKDSTAILQLVWMALESLPADQRTKPVHVISTDTLVENPIVSRWVTNSLLKMNEAADAAELPIHAHKLTPEVRNSFWVNLLGKGYPAPRHMFRWCTERLKIMPSNTFIRGVVQDAGEAILVLGTRKAESSRRAATMAKHEKRRVRDRLSPNASLINSQIYSPIEDWSNDDVWLYLMQVKNPWGYANKDLLTMYQGATDGGECPLVVDSSTPSCGDSRFGCWVCTLVNEDKSMTAMVQNDAEKEWMLPMLQFRNRLAVKNEEGKWNDRSLRDHRRLSGRLTEFNGRLVHGPYKQGVREEWLKELLIVQRWLRDNGPEYVRDVELINLAELEEIRRIWVVEKHEIEDRLPVVYEEAMGEPYPGQPFHENSVLGTQELELLRETCAENREEEAGAELYGLLRGLLDVEQRYRTMTKRKGLYVELESVLDFYQFDDEADAQRAIEARALDKAKKKDDHGLLTPLEPRVDKSLRSKKSDPTQSDGQLDLPLKNQTA